MVVGSRVGWGEGGDWGEGRCGPDGEVGGGGKEGREAGAPAELSLLFFTP